MLRALLQHNVGRGGPLRWAGGVWMAALLAAGLASACVDYLPIDVVDGESVPVVLALVEAGQDSVFVALGRSGPGTAAGPASGATLALTTPAGVTDLREVDPVAFDCGVPEGFSCYVGALPAALAPGDSASLSGVFAEGEQIAAGTRIPDVPVRLDGHAPGDTVRWVDRIGEAPILELLPGSERISQRDSVLDATWWDGGEQGACPQPAPFNPRFDLRGGIYFGPLHVLLADPRCDGVQRTQWDSLSTSLVLLGFDTNATEWYARDGTFWRSEGARWGVEGALGFFGSVTPGAFVLRVVARSVQP